MWTPPNKTRIIIILVHQNKTCFYIKCKRLTLRYDLGLTLPHPISIRTKADTRHSVSFSLPRLTKLDVESPELKQKLPYIHLGSIHVHFCRQIRVYIIVRETKIYIPTLVFFTGCASLCANISWWAVAARSTVRGGKKWFSKLQTLWTTYSCSYLVYLVCGFESAKNIQRSYAIASIILMCRSV